MGVKLPNVAVSNTKSLREVLEAFASGKCLR